MKDNQENNSENNDHTPETDAPDNKKENETKLLITKNDQTYKTINFKEKRKDENFYENENLKKLWIVTIICLIFFLIELIGGYIAYSIAIISDAAHLLSDLLGFVISIVSIYISRRNPSKKMTYGYHRSEVIGALLSISVIWVLTVILIYEAVLRLIDKTPVNGLIMIVVALLGFVFNIVMGFVLIREGIDHTLHSHDHYHECENKSEKTDNDLQIKENKKYQYSDVHNHSHEHKHNHEHKHSHTNLNIQASIVHVIGDAIQNIGVLIAGIIIHFKPEFRIADSICTFIFSIIVVFTTVRIFRDCLSILMEGSPTNFELENLENDLLYLEGVIDIHNLHIWSLSSGKLSFSCHIICDNPQETLSEATDLCKEKYDISFLTIQVESSKEKISNKCDKVYL